MCQGLCSTRAAQYYASANIPEAFDEGARSLRRSPWREGLGAVEGQRERAHQIRPGPAPKLSIPLVRGLLANSQSWVALPKDDQRPLARLPDLECLRSER